MFPLAVGLGAVAPTATAVFFDRRWADVAPMLMILSALSVVRPIGWTIGSYLMARDRTRAFMWLEGFKLVALVGCLIGLAPFGPLVACGAVGLAFGLHSVASMWVVKKLDGPALSRFFTGVLPPLLACVPMVAAILVVRKGLAALGVHWKVVTLAAEVTVGGLVYLAAALVVARSVSSEFLRLLRNALNRRKEP
jgi:PST family polysaccharide transporter